MARPMSEGSKKVLEVLKGGYVENKEWTTAELASAAGVSTAVVTGSVTGMCNKNFAERFPKTIESTIVKDGVESKVEKTVKMIKLTEAGYNFDPATLEEQPKAE